MANDMMDTLKGILGDNADEKIQTVLNGLQAGSGNSNMQSTSKDGVGDINDYVDQLKNIVGNMGSANDSRSKLLMSLKPYMRAERQKSIDNAVKILNLTKFTGLFK